MKTNEKTQPQTPHKHPVQVQAYWMDLSSMQEIEKSQYNHPDDGDLQRWALLHLLYMS